MFKIVASILFLVNGTPISEPFKTTNNVGYATEAECAAGMEDPEIKTAMERLDAMVGTTSPAGTIHKITFACEKFDDGSI